MLSKYFVYAHLKRDDGRLFYVGKGVNRANRLPFERASTYFHRNPMWKNTVKKHGGFDVGVLFLFDSNDDALAMERILILMYGRKDNGSGCLTNMTNGGEGSLGIVVSEKTRKLRSVRVKGGNHPNYWKKLSAETCKKKSKALTGEKHHLYGKKLPQEWRENIRQSKMGKDNPMYGKAGFSHPRGKKVQNTKSGVIYGSIMQAAKAEGISPSMLYQCLDGSVKNKTTLVRI